MNLALLLHIYQPPIQESKIIEEIAESSYLPLLKSIKNQPNFKVTINIPLSLSYQLQAAGQQKVIDFIKELYETNKIELTSTGAYHPILTKLPEYLVEKEIILNEYGLGYYYGKDKGFEGQEALMIKNVCGFFPPELSVNQELVKELDQMGYHWVLVDQTAVQKDTNQQAYHPVYNFKDLGIKVVCRDANLSNMLSFKRDTEVNDLVDYIQNLRQEGKDAVVALDGEFFGHHFVEGIFLLETFTDTLESLGISLTTVSELIEGSDEVAIKEIRESSWGASPQQMEEGIIYPLWDYPGNKLHEALWELQKRVAASAEKDFGHMENMSQGSSFETFPIWDLDALDGINDVKLKNQIYKDILLLQSMHSDQFWWASNFDVGGKKMYDPSYVEKSLALYEKYATVAQDEALQAEINQAQQEIKGLL